MLARAEGNGKESAQSWTALALFFPSLVFPSMLQIQLGWECSGCFHWGKRRWGQIDTFQRDV